MPEIEDDLKLNNWLSVLTFDVYKYARAGGAVVVEWTADGLELRLSAVGPETEGVNAKFARAFPVPAPAAAEEPRP